MRKLLVLLLPLFFTACGDGGNNLTGPTSTIPNVAGNYSGTMTASLPELGRSVSCRATTTVTQGGGGSVSIAPIQLTGDCGLTSLPFGSATIDATGSLGSTTATLRESCGTYNASGSGGFFGRELRLSMVYVSSTCYNMNITITLTRA
ncbi:MAG: hypothetical protein AB7L71_03980 [Vicinamibacterales bacterium]